MREDPIWEVEHKKRRGGGGHTAKKERENVRGMASEEVKGREGRKFQAGVMLKVLYGREVSRLLSKRNEQQQQQQ